MLSQVKNAITSQKLPDCDWHIAAIDHIRAMNLSDLLNYVYRYVDSSNVHCYDSLALATQGVIQQSDECDLILAFGSFHTISESLIELANQSSSVQAV